MKTHDVPWSEVIRLRESGLKIREVASKVGICTWTVRQILRDCGVLLGRPTIVIPREELERLWVQPLTLEQIAIACGCSKSTVTKHALQYGMPRKPMPKIVIDRAKLERLWSQPLTLVEIAIKLGCSKSTVSKRAADIGLPPKQFVWRCPGPAPDPTPEQIAERAREVRERHFAKRRNESEKATQHKTRHVLA